MAVNHPPLPTCPFFAKGFLFLEVKMRSVNSMRDAVITQETRKEWFPSIADILNEVPAFGSKKEALQKAREFGWRNVVKIEGRFGVAFIVGGQDLQSDFQCDIAYDVIRVPLLRFENGVQPVIKTRMARNLRRAK